MAKKQFKIGEYARGGIIQVETTKTKVTIQALDWYTKEPIYIGEVEVERGYEYNTDSNILEHLNCLTSAYYAEKIINWIKSKL
jgi:hypothetical protein